MRGGIDHSMSAMYQETISSILLLSTFDLRQPKEAQTTNANPGGSHGETSPSKIPAFGRRRYGSAGIAGYRICARLSDAARTLNSRLRRGRGDRYCRSLD